MAFNPSEAAATLRKAMKGFGTDDATLIDTICGLTNEQVQIVREAYQQEQQRDLIEDIKSETGGAEGKALVGLILTPAEYDAQNLKQAIKGMGTNEEVFVQTLCHRTTEEIAAISEAYNRMYGKSLADDIAGDFSGEGKKVALGLITYNRASPKVVIPEEVDAWVDTLYNAGEGKMGTDEDTFVEAICSSGPAWLKAINEAYGRKHGHTLMAAVKKEFSGFAAKTLEAMMEDHDTYYAYLIKRACQGAGTDDAQLVRTVVSRRHRLREINSKFMEGYQVSIANMVEKEVSGDFARIVKAVVAAA